MKRIWVLILLVSVGLNIGLGWAVLRQDQKIEDRQSRWTRTVRNGSSQGDSLRWQRLMTRRTDMVARRLDLSSAQIEAFQAVQQTAGPGIHASRRRVEEARSRLDDLMAGSPLDRRMIRDAVAELGGRQAVLDSLVAESLLREMEILDRNQREKYLKIMPFGRGRETPGRGHRRSAGPGR